MYIERFVKKKKMNEVLIPGLDEEVSLKSLFEDSQ